MRDRSMQRLDSLLSRFLQQFQNDEEKTNIFLKELWPEVVGEQLSRRTQPIRFRKGKLWIGVAGPHWKKELEPLAESMREAVNRFWGSGLVRRITLVVQEEKGREHF